MIYTITLNPAVDYYVLAPDFKLGSLNSAQNSYTLAGGKGINVSKVLKNLNTNSKAIGFLGGFTGDYIIKDLEKADIPHNFIRLENDTRINVKLKTNENESEIAGNSPNITKENLEDFLDIFRNVKETDILVLSGSVPASIDDDIYKRIVDLVPKNTKIILDTRGLPFKKALGNKIFLTKPNVVELGEYFNETYNDIHEIIKAGKRLQKLGSQNVLISRGGDGSILITKDKVYIGNVPSGKLVSSVGAGDSMVAGFIYGIYNNLSLEEAFIYGIAAGTGTAYKKGLANLDDVKHLINNITVYEEK